jgi:tetratricopeptide (TPR) repeat protein
MAAYAKALYLGLVGQIGEAKTITEVALRHNPNLAPLYAQLGIVDTGLGEYDQAKSDIEEARRLSPRDPQIGLWEFLYGRAELGLGHYAEAIDAEHRALDDNFRPHWPHEVLAAAYALAERTRRRRTNWSKQCLLIPKSPR